MSEKTFTLECEGVKIVVTAMNATQNGITGVEFDIQLVEGKADLIGFFLDPEGDGGDVRTAGSDRQNNMNGQTDSCDEPITGFDYAWVIGQAGLNDGETTQETVFKEGLTLAALDNAIVGVRATSVQSDFNEETGEYEGREDSLKLVGTADENGDDDCDAFPSIPNISNIVLYFDAIENNLTEYDVKPGGGDGFFTFKVDEVESQIMDLDDDLDTILAYLADDLDGPDGISADDLAELFLGAHFKFGLELDFYASCESGNGDAEQKDPFPTLDGKAITDSDIDREADYDDVFGVVPEVVSDEAFA